MDDATRKTMAVRLGLAEDASEDDINDEIDRLKNQTSGQQGAADTAPAADSYGTTGPSPEKGDAGGAQTQSGPAVLSPDTGEAKPEGDQPAGESDTDAGMIRVDKDTFDRLKRGSEAALAMQEQSRATEIAALLDGAVQAGKIAPARREHWAAALKADFDGNKAVLSSLADGLVPVGERGTAGNTEEGGGAGAQAEGLPSAWFPEIAAARNRQSSPVINAREG